MNPLVIDNDDNTIINGETLLHLFLEWIDDEESFLNYLDDNYTPSRLYYIMTKNPNFKQDIMIDYLKWCLYLAQDKEDLILCDVQPIF